MILLFVSMVLIGVNYLQAWQGPTQTAPNGNVSAPINVGSTYQAKQGDLGVVSIRAGYFCTADGSKCATLEELLADNLGEGGTSGFPLTGASTFFADARVKDDIKKYVTRSWMSGSWSDREQEGVYVTDYVRLRFASDIETTNRICELLNAGTTQVSNDFITQGSLYTYDRNPQPDKVDTQQFYDGAGIFNYKNGTWYYSLHYSVLRGEMWQPGNVRTEGTQLTPSPVYMSLSQLSCGE